MQQSAHSHHNRQSSRPGACIRNSRATSHQRGRQCSAKHTQGTCPAIDLFNCGCAWRTPLLSLSIALHHCLALLSFSRHSRVDLHRCTLLPISGMPASKFMHFRPIFQPQTCIPVGIFSLCLRCSEMVGERCAGCSGCSSSDC